MERWRRYEDIRRNNPQLLEARRIRRSPQWTRLSQWYRQVHPLCSDPFGEHKRLGRIVAASEVHHRIGLAERPDLAFDVNNLMAVCRSCHRQLDAVPRVYTGGDGGEGRSISPSLTP